MFIYCLDENINSSNLFLSPYLKGDNSLFPLGLKVISKDERKSYL